MRRSFARGEVDVDGETVGYSCYTIDARHDERRTKNARENALDGNLVVYLPGHIQPANAARQLHAAVIDASRSGVLWSVDIDPPRGGDPTKAAALVSILHQKASEELFENPELALERLRVTVIGWSHGGAEALRAAERAPEMIDSVIALCPTGLEDQTAIRIIGRLPFEATRVARDLFRQNLETVWASLRLGILLTRGLVTDLYRTRSPKRLVSDVRWAARKVVGPHYGYAGSVVIVFGENDTLIRWRRIFPDCNQAEDLAGYLGGYCERDFPCVRDLEMHVLAGNHLAPELRASEYVQIALEALNRLGKHL